MNTINRYKHTAIYHIPGAKFKISRESSFICISCGKPYKNQRSLIKHSKRCTGMIMIDTLQDISVNEIEAPGVTQHLNDTITNGIPVSLVSNATAKTDYSCSTGAHREQFGHRETWSLPNQPSRKHGHRITWTQC